MEAEADMKDANKRDDAKDAVKKEGNLEASAATATKVFDSSLFMVIHIYDLCELNSVLICWITLFVTMTIGNCA